MSRLNYHLINNDFPFAEDQVSLLSLTSSPFVIWRGPPALFSSVSCMWMNKICNALVKLLLTSGIHFLPHILTLSQECPLLPRLIQEKSSLTISQKDSPSLLNPSVIHLFSWKYACMHLRYLFNIMLNSFRSYELLSSVCSFPLLGYKAVWHNG